MSETMTLLQVLTAYVNMLWSQLQYDIDVFSQPWIYWWALVPAISYLTFFVLKWFVLLIPIAGPLAAITTIIASIFSRN